ncbi:MAG TPA: ankyrin repeat domain-containing protein [Bradyrhizobium sp.]|jgi:hypothetical protein|nr:ankyrin repeat domain-containing protein [Bradyrhizobium sp.]
MTDPMTIGALGALALGIAAEAVLKGAVGEAVKDAYKALKTKVAVWASSDVEALLSEPNSTDRQSTIAESVDRQPEDVRAEVAVLTAKLIAALKSEGNAGLDISDLQAMEVSLGNIKVAHGVGARFKNTMVHGSFKTGDIEVQSAQTEKFSPTDTVPAAAGIGALLQNNVIGGNVQFTLISSRADQSLNELCRLLEDRALAINERLQDHFRYTDVAQYLKEFNVLHERHLAALRKGNLIAAHELLIKIHDVSSRLTASEFWKQSEKIFGGVQYQLNGDEFERGALITRYMESCSRAHDKEINLEQRIVAIYRNAWLYLASGSGAAETVAALLDAGADVHACDDCALQQASKNGHTTIVKALVDAGADIHADDDNALRDASAHGHAEIVDFLLKLGADIHADRDGALRYASENGHVGIVATLLAVGGDVHAADDVALVRASYNGHTKVVRALVDAGARVRTMEDLALRCASENGHAEIVDILLNAGANERALRAGDFRWFPADLK